MSWLFFSPLLLGGYILGLDKITLKTSVSAQKLWFGVNVTI